MNLIQELRQRRVFQIVSAYVVAGWSILQFLAFLEDRMAISPHLVNLVGWVFLFLLPSVITLAWVHGRPGRDAWGRAPKIVVPANVLAATLLLVIMFSGRDLGAVTRTIAVEDEEGAITERVVPKNEYRRRLLVFYPVRGGDQEDAWASEVFAYLLGLDLDQDVFVDSVLPLAMAETLREAGSPDGHGLSRPQQRKVARDARIGYFLTGSLERRDRRWVLATELHESESGKIAARRDNEADDLFSLVDQVSRQLRADLGIPVGHLADNPDLPIADQTSTDILAVAAHVRAMLAITHGNDWEEATRHLEEAVGLDPSFAVAQFLLFNVRQTLGDAAGAADAIDAAMETLYRVPERLGFMIKSQYYYNQEQDADKAMAVLRMWTQIYPEDVNAYQNQAMFYFIRQDLPNTIAAYEKILAIDPSRVNFLEDLADLHTQMGDLDKAESCLKRYLEILPTSAQGLKNLSDFYSDTGRLDEAREALAQAQLLEPGDLDLALGLVDLDIKAGKYSESKQILDDFLTEHEAPGDRRKIYIRQVRLATYEGQPDVLIDRLEKFYEAMLETQNPLHAHIAQAVLLIEISSAGRPEEALRRLAEVKSKLPAVFSGLVGLGEAWAHVDLGRVPEARASLATATATVDAFKFETYRPYLDLVEGMIDEVDGDLDTAIPHYRDAVDKALRNEPFNRYRLARALRLSGAEKEARSVLQEGLKAEPVYPWFQLELAHLEEAKGDKEQARKHLDLALAAWSGAGPEFLPAQEARRLANLLDSN